MLNRLRLLRMNDPEVQVREVTRSLLNLTDDNARLLLNLSHTLNLSRAQRETVLSALTGEERVKLLHLSDIVEKVPQAHQAHRARYKTDLPLPLPLLDTFERLRSPLLVKLDRYPIYPLLTLQTLFLLPRAPTLDSASRILSTLHLLHQV